MCTYTEEEKKINKRQYYFILRSYNIYVNGEATHSIYTFLESTFEITEERNEKKKKLTCDCKLSFITTRCWAHRMLGFHFFFYYFNEIDTPEIILLSYHWTICVIDLFGYNIDTCKQSNNFFRSFFFHFFQNRKCIWMVIRHQKCYSLMKWFFFVINTNVQDSSTRFFHWHSCENE